MSLCTHGVQTGEGYECSSCVTSPTFAEQIDTHLQRLAAERPAPVTPAEERTGVSDVQAEVQKQVEALRQDIGDYGDKCEAYGYEGAATKRLALQAVTLAYAAVTARLARIEQLTRGEAR